MTSLIATLHNHRQVYPQKSIISMQGERRTAPQRRKQLGRPRLTSTFLKKPSANTDKSEEEEVHSNNVVQLQSYKDKLGLVGNKNDSSIGNKSYPHSSNTGSSEGGPMVPLFISCEVIPDRDFLQFEQTEIARLNAYLNGNNVKLEPLHSYNETSGSQDNRADRNGSDRYHISLTRSRLFVPSHVAQSAVAGVVRRCKKLVVDTDLHKASWRLEFEPNLSYFRSEDDKRWFASVKISNPDKGDDDINDTPTTGPQLIHTLVRKVADAAVEGDAWQEPFFENAEPHVSIAWWSSNNTNLDETTGLPKTAKGKPFVSNPGGSCPGSCLAIRVSVSAGPHSESIDLH